MTPVQIAALQARINALSNGAVRQAAQNAFNNVGSGNTYAYEQLDSMLNKSARVDGKTAVFYSGEGGRNEALANDCARDTLDQNGYLLKDTDAGRTRNRHPGAGGKQDPQRRVQSVCFGASRAAYLEPALCRCYWQRIAPVKVGVELQVLTNSSGILAKVIHEPKRRPVTRLQ